MKPICLKEGCKIESAVKGFCKFHYVMPSKLNPKPISKSVKTKEKSKALPGSKKSVPALLLEAQKVFNHFVRLRDAKDGYFVCAACNGMKPLSKMHAGHFYSAGHHSYLRFNENNVHGCCVRCNMYLSGNLLPYRENLLKKIGEKELQKLDMYKNHPQRWDRIQLLALIQLYKQKVKDFL